MGTNVDLLPLGGTIAASGVRGTGVTPRLSGEELLASVVATVDTTGIEVVGIKPSPVPGPHLRLDDAIAIARVIAERRAAGRGTVITQGTDTIEEMAFALDVLLDPGSPVVVTGAMRDSTQPGADGPGNLAAALRVAATPEASGLGVLVVMADEVHAARAVRKLHTSRTGAFASPATGALGHVVEGQVHLAARPFPSPTVDLNRVTGVADVALLVAILGDDGRLLDHLARASYAGVVYEAFGGGHVAPVVADRLERVARALPVVVASRTGAGRLLRSTYDFAGSERDLRRRGLPFADDLTGIKARVLLALLLSAGADHDEIGAAFEGRPQP